MDAKWQLLQLKFNKDIHQALMLQHHAVQFIAMAGRHLIPQKTDDSNTNMQYIFNNYMLVGNLVSDKLKVGLHLIDFNLHILDPNFASKGKIQLESKSREQVFKELKEEIRKHNIDVSTFIRELHYEIPGEGLDRNNKFFNPGNKFFKENMLYRHNAQLILEELNRDFKSAEPVRIWPHHFDTGTHVPLAYHKGKLTKSYGLGWAIPDDMVSEPYFYLSLWSANQNLDFSDLPSPEYGEWIKTGWSGGVLKHSDVVSQKTAHNQYNMVKRFFESGIQILQQTYKTN